MTGTPRLLKIEEAAKQLNISRSLAYRLVGDGELRTIKVGRLRRVPVEALTEFIDQASAKEAACYA